MRLLYGTGNESKLTSMRENLKDLDIEIVGLKEMKRQVEAPEETGSNPLENAKIKALYYYSQYKTPLFSCDTGLFIEGLQAKDQPGVFVRRVGGRNLNDEEMIEHYSGIASRLGGKAKAKYKNGICLVMDESNIFCYDGEDISWKDFWITSEPSLKRSPRFPLDSISVDIATGRYFMDISYGENASEESEVRNGFKNFFIRSLAEYKK